MSKQPFYTHTVFLAILACILWSTAFPSIKIGLNYTTPLQFAGIRFMISGLILIPFCRNIRKDMVLVRKNAGKVMLISLFQTTILYTFFYIGINRTPAAIGAIVVGAGPLFVAILAHFITGRDALTRRKVIALLIGFTGIILLALYKEKNSENHFHLISGILLLITGNLAGSMGNILVSQNRTGISPIFLNTMQIFLGGFIILLISVFTEGCHFGPKPIAYYVTLTWLSIMSAMAFTFWFIVLNRPAVKVSEINVWKFIIPVIGVILSWLLIKIEKPQWHTVSGMLLIAAAIIIIYGRFSKNKPLRQP